MPATVRISPATHQASSEMARAKNSSLQQMLDQAVENERRRLLLEGTNLAYAKLRRDKKAWRAWQNELRPLDATLNDGL